jgi:hypothetical protein
MLSFELIPIPTRILLSPTTTTLYRTPIPTISKQRRRRRIRVDQLMGDGNERSNGTVRYGPSYSRPTLRVSHTFFAIFKVSRFPIHIHTYKQTAPVHWLGVSFRHETITREGGKMREIGEQRDICIFHTQTTSVTRCALAMYSTTHVMSILALYIFNPITLCQEHVYTHYEQYVNSTHFLYRIY